jgi:integrase
MARRKPDARLNTRTARLKLPIRREPYWANLSAGLALGYRRGATGGTWIARRYTAENGRTYAAIGPADDTLDAGALSFDAAQGRAREWFGHQPHDDEPARGPYTVADAIAAYLRHLEGDGRSAFAVYDARRRADASILPALGNVQIVKLTTDRLRRWRDTVASTPPRRRTRDGDKQRHGDPPTTEDEKRARRATVNRTWTCLRATLNHAFHNGKVASDIAWRRVKPFRNVDSARIRYLTIAEARRLLNACDPEFRPLVQAALQTGARYGELTRLEVCDFNPDSRTVAIRKGKGGKGRHIVLTDEGAKFFQLLTAGRAGHEIMLRKASGEAFGPSHQRRPMQDAVAHAKITPTISFHGLRHTWASLAVMNAMPLMVVARNLGHVDTRMVEKHYGHLAPSYVADAVRKSAPRFGFKPDKKLAVLGGRT